MPRSRSLRPLLWVLLVALPAAGCAVSQPDIPVRSYLAGDFERVRAFAEQESVDGDVENLALVLSVQGQCELFLGDFAAARRSLQRAAQIMGTWAVSSGEATAAIVGSESSKNYKGDPYEKAMNAFYLAFSYLMEGEPDNARAALKRGILMDAEVADEKYQADNALLFWMAGRMSTMFAAGDAADLFQEAATAHRFAIEHGSRGDPDSPVIRNPGRGNLVLLLPIGLGPEKYADGSERELARFRAQPHPAVAAAATLDGESLGRSSILNDVVYQAKTLGGTAMEGIRQGKAVFKKSSRIAGIVLLNEGLRNRDRNRDKAQAQAIAGGALILLSALTSTTADTRHWPTLPSTVQVLTADVPPGRHELVVDFLDGRGRPVRKLQHRLQIEIPESGETWLMLPSLPQPAPPTP